MHFPSLTLLKQKRTALNGLFMSVMTEYEVPLLPLRKLQQQQQHVCISLIEHTVCGLAVCLASLCIFCLVFLLLDWHSALQCRSTASSWQFSFGPHLASCGHGLPESELPLLTAARACLIVLDLAGMCLAVTVLRLKGEGASWDHDPSAMPKGVHTPVLLRMCMQPGSVLTY